MKSSWYCLFGKEAGKILDIRGLRDRDKKEVNITYNISALNLIYFACIRTRHIAQHIHLSDALPHSVRQSQDTQAEEVDRQQQVDVLLRKYLHQSTCPT